MTRGASTYTSDQLALIEIERKNQMHYTPSKMLGAKRISSDDDTQILKLAAAKGAVIVSNDNFKRFRNHNVEFKLVVDERVLMYSFIDDEFMPADNLLGKTGPSLDNFLRFEYIHNEQYMKRCPYKKKCTYGAKCKFWHPERLEFNQGDYKSVHQIVKNEANEQRMKFETILNNAPTPFVYEIAMRPNPGRYALLMRLLMQQLE
jgi:hypothetical protein